MLVVILLVLPLVTMNLLVLPLVTMNLVHHMITYILLPVCFMTLSHLQLSMLELQT